MAWVNYATICRLCLQEDGYLLGIFNNHINQNFDNSIQRKIFECTTLELSSEDGLPPCICHRCLYKVELCLEFKQQCLVSDATLRHLNCHILSRRNEDETHLELDNTLYNKSTVSVGVDEFEKFTHENQKFIPDHGQNVENVVMVVNPDLDDYDSENESDYEHQHNGGSDVENTETEAIEFNEQLRNVFMCKYCDRAYIERDQCQIHETSEHNPKAPFLCAQCEMAFADRTNYTAHLKSVHQNDKPFGCPQCPRSFSRRSDLRKHTVVHTGIKPFTCHICYKSFSRNTNLTKHLRIHSGNKPYVCPQCPKTFISKGDLTRHALIHSGHKPFACGYCDQTFGRRDKLLRHEKRHFPNGSEDRSEAVSAELEILRQQMALSGYSGYSTAVATVNLLHHNDAKNVPIKVIDNKSRNKIDEKIEILNTINNNDGSGTDAAVAVVTASTTTTTNANTTSVVTTNTTPVTSANDEDNAEWHHNSEKMVISVDPFNHDDTNELLPRIPEHITGDTFVPVSTSTIKIEYDNISNENETATTSTTNNKTKNNIQQLKSTVNAIKKYPCLSCNKRFASAESLRFHTATHSGNKPHACNQCNKSFLRKRELDRHMATHTGMKPFKCSHCDKRFGRKDKLVRHTRIHRLIVPSSVTTKPTTHQSLSQSQPLL